MVEEEVMELKTTPLVERPRFTLHLPEGTGHLEEQSPGNSFSAFSGNLQCHLFTVVIVWFPTDIICFEAKYMAVGD